MLLVSLYACGFLIDCDTNLQMLDGSQMLLPSSDLTKRFEQEGKHLH